MDFDKLQKILLRASSLDSDSPADSNQFLIQPHLHFPATVNTFAEFERILVLSLKKITLYAVKLADGLLHELTIFVKYSPGYR